MYTKTYDVDILEAYIDPNGCGSGRANVNGLEADFNIVFGSVGSSEFEPEDCRAIDDIFPALLKLRKTANCLLIRMKLKHQGY